jgi:hypothetical protein
MEAISVNQVFCQVFDTRPDPMLVLMKLLLGCCVQDAVERGWLRDVPSSKHGKPNMASIAETAFEVGGHTAGSHYALHAGLSSHS